MPYIKIHMLLLLFLLSSFGTYGQNYIGMHRDSIQKILRKDFPDFRLDNSTTNNTYNYLKFVDRVKDQTVLFFLSNNDRCSRVRWISDYSNLSDMKIMLDKKYRKEGDKKWIYKFGGKDYGITLDEEEWYFTVSFFED